ncbi:MAG: WG repeat-containing protein [Saprospiraceae bacterium]|nr:WG repeat-containing protein [Saprospiraceae bacterium]
MFTGFHKYPFTHSFFLLCIICSLACKSDIDYDKANPIEAQYFEDYESPDSKWGYIDTRAEVIIEPQFDEARDFSCQRAAVNLKGKWGFIDRSGQLVIDPKFKQVLDFSDDRSFVQDFNLKWWLVDVSGDTISSVQYDDFRPYKDFMAVVNLGGTWGVIDRSGQEIIPVVYQGIKLMGMNSFALKSAEGWQLQNAEFDNLIEGYFDNMKYAGAGNIKIYKGGLCRIFNVVNSDISKAYKRTTEFQNDKCWAFDGTNHILLDAQFNELTVFSADRILVAGENMWRFKRNGKWGLVDDKGRIKVPAKFDFLNAFRSRRAVMGLVDAWGYIDPFGNQVINPVLPLAWDFHSGRARIIDYGGFGMIDTSGTLIIAAQFTELRDFYEGRARFQP